MKQKERSVGRLPVIVLPRKKKKNTHRNSHEESILPQPFLSALNVDLILEAAIAIKWQKVAEQDRGESGSIMTSLHC